jgi:hypothetical protein
MKAINDLIKFTRENNLPMKEVIKKYEVETKKLYSIAYQKDSYPYLDEIDNNAVEIIKRHYE